LSQNTTKILQNTAKYRKIPQNIAKYHKNVNNYLWIPSYNVKLLVDVEVPELTYDIYQLFVQEPPKYILTSWHCKRFKRASN